MYSDGRDDSRPETPTSNNAEVQEPRVVRDKALAKVGDLYEIQPEEIDGED